MKDEYDEQLDDLFQRIRMLRPDIAAVEHHFETRLLARLEERQSGQALWSFWTWRLVPLFSVIVIIVGIGSMVIDPARSTDLFAAFTNGYEEYQATSLLAGG
jgi:hypothetical protein